MDHREILDLVAHVRRRWRLRVTLRGLAMVAAATAAALFLSSLILERVRFAPTAVVWLRVLTWGTLGTSLYYFLFRPLRKRVTDQQVALYLEEHEPSLEHTLVSALDAGRSESASPSLTRRIVQSALDKARLVDNGRRVEQQGLYRFGGALTAVAVASLALALLGPSHLRSGLAALLLPTRDAAAASPYAIAVTPGDVTIARGADQVVTANLSGFEAGEASVFTRSDESAPFQRLSMLLGEDGSFEMMLLEVGDRTEYFVESTGIRSPRYTIEVADLPYVDQLDLTYYFPSYTGMPPRTVEDGGDVAALPGTVVELRIKPTMPAPNGRIVMDGTPGNPLETSPDGTLVGRFTVGERGYYAVELARDNGDLVAASPEYTIDVLEDQEPSVSFNKPGRDTPASPLEEVYLEVRADDDYGVGDVRLVYSVNGGAEDTLSIFEAGGAPLAQISAGHTLFLEEWELEPGDLVSYYALVRDNRTRAGGKPIASDMYFLTIRPLDIAFRQAESMGGGGGGGGGGQQPPESALSELQRQIIAATFNLHRQRDSYEASELDENVVSVALAQGRLREQVGTLLERMQNRGLAESDPGFRDVSAILPKAAEAMQKAQDRLDDKELQQAIPEEQTALRFLQQAEETYERYVQQQQQQGGGGGGGGAGQQAAEDLADLFELELDKLKNQYETVRRGEQQTSDDEVDEVLEKLKELARRQEQEAERQRRRAAQQGAQGGQGASGDAQRELADQAEEAARQLQRLARQNADQRLEETARSLQQAAESMRRSATGSGNAGSAEATSALDRLEEARRRLQESQEDRARRDADEAMRQVDELARQQREVTRDVRELPAQGSAGRTQEIQGLRERKNQMTEAVSALEQELDRAASVARAEQPEAARKLQDAANQIRESKLKEKVQFSRGTIEQWDEQSAVTLELNIEADLQSLKDRLEEAAGAAGESEESPLRGALDDTRELVRGMEAMDRRLREPTGQRGEQGQQPGEQQGQGQGQQPGEQPGQGQQPGEQQGQGQQGQGQQGQGQQGQGQQGQGQQGQGQRGGQQGGQQGGGNPNGGDGFGDLRDNSYGGGATRGDPRRLSPEEVRQFQREFLERGELVGDLRDRLVAEGRDVAELQAVLDAMQRLQREGVYDSPATVAALNDAILESLKRLEFGLRREVEGAEDGRAAMGGSTDVPEAYRKLVDEYYRKLAGAARPPGD